MSDETQVLDLRRIRKPLAGRVTLEDGSVHDVLQSRGKHYQALKAIKPSEAMERIYEIARELVPTMSNEQAQELNLDQANAIIGVAGLGVAAVEAMYPPNAESPATSTLTSPG